MPESLVPDSEDDEPDQSPIGQEDSQLELSGADEDEKQHDMEAEGQSPELRLQKQKTANIQALLSNRLQTNRQALLPRLLNVVGAEAVLRKAFKSPHPSAPSSSVALKIRLMARRKFVPWGGGASPANFSSPLVRPMPDEPAEPEPETTAGEPEGEPLVLWEPPEGQAGRPVAVDPMLTKWLRPHQREGVQFMFECVAGLRDFKGHGCILADDMGLGKTLQGITLLWTLLKNGHEFLGGDPIAKRVIIVCPTSLVSNWDSECDKWLKGRVKTLPLCESSRDDVIHSVSQFLSPRNPFQVLIVSYETFRLHAEKFKGEHACDLLICDEAHRLKNDQTLTNKALDSLACKRRVLLSGTPMQNHLDEFYAMVNFCNPAVLGSPAAFRRQFEGPILAGREPDAEADVAVLGAQRSNELSAIVNQFILRRTNALLSAHLPPKVVEVVCCRMTELQRGLYCHFLESNAAAKLLAGRKAARVLSAITALKKLCNHPKLIYDVIHAPSAQEGGVDGFEDCDQFFPPGMFDDGRLGRGSMALGWETLSGKFAVAAKMLAKLRADTSDRIVIVSNYTQTLDLFAQLCRVKQYPFLRLDGTTTITKRQKLVKQFNDQAQRQFVFLLSSKAGGCGLNLIGGNRLILFDPDWNPANDKQAAARVWRDGQTKRVFVYRFLTTGSIEEKVYQRQLSKEGLQSVVNKSEGPGGAGGSNMMSTEELRDLFTLRPDTRSDTYDSMCAREEGDGTGGDADEQAAERLASHAAASTSAAAGCNAPAICRPQIGAPAEEDLKSWGQHSSTATVPDAVMQHIGDAQVSFVFSCQVDGKPLENEQVIPVNRPAAPALTPEQAASRAPQHSMPAPSQPAAKGGAAAIQALSTPGIQLSSGCGQSAQAAIQQATPLQPCTSKPLLSGAVCPSTFSTASAGKDPSCKAASRLSQQPAKSRSALKTASTACHTSKAADRSQGRQPLGAISNKTTADNFPAAIDSASSKRQRVEPVQLAPSKPLVVASDSDDDFI